jgi:hypothetical protein
MKYATISEAGVLELRENSSKELPEGAIPLTNEQYIQLCEGSHIIVDGKIVINPEFPA